MSVGKGVMCVRTELCLVRAGRLVCWIGERCVIAGTWLSVTVRAEFSVS